MANFIFLLVEVSIRCFGSQADVTIDVPLLGVASAHAIIHVQHTREPLSVIRAVAVFSVVAVTEMMFGLQESHPLVPPVTFFWLLKIDSIC